MKLYSALSDKVNCVCGIIILVVAKQSQLDADDAVEVLLNLGAMESFLSYYIQSSTESLKLSLQKIKETSFNVTAAKLSEEFWTDFEDLMDNASSVSSYNVYMLEKLLRKQKSPLSPGLVIKFWNEFMKTLVAELNTHPSTSRSHFPRLYKTVLDNLPLENNDEILAIVRTEFHSIELKYIAKILSNGYELVKAFFGSLSRLKGTAVSQCQRLLNEIMKSLNEVSFDERLNAAIHKVIDKIIDSFYHSCNEKMVCMDRKCCCTFICLFIMRF